MSKILRSFLFVPADSEKKLAKAGGLGADALILDLEDAVLPANKALGRQLASAYLREAKTSSQIWVRINALDSEYAAEDLEAIVPLAPDGIMLPKPDGPVDIETLSRRLDRLEAKHGLPLGGIKILPVATETARAVMSLSLYPRTHLPRLLGLTWGAEDLATDIGAITNKGPDGNFSFTYQVVRSHTLLAAKAAGVQAVDTLYDNFRDKDGLRARAGCAFSEGFTGMLAIHPAQVPIINKSFTPTDAQLRHANSVIQAFEDNPGAGAVQVAGKMVDIPHLTQAQNILALYEGIKP
ncbi:MAG: CoA ester lyase [Robiginitomaculum sp.]|nr:MAG: CoA ester lyase [Robiginitomaculum sp.]